jgi:hypothetical protein
MKESIVTFLLYFIYVAVLFVELLKKIFLSPCVLKKRTRVTKIDWISIFVYLGCDSSNTNIRSFSDKSTTPNSHSTCSCCWIQLSRHWTEIWNSSGKLKNEKLFTRFLIKCFSPWKTFHSKKDELYDFTSEYFSLKVSLYKILYESCYFVHLLPWVN